MVSSSSLPRVLIVGGNFAGLAAARALDAGKIKVTVIDRSPTAEWLPNVHELLSRRKSLEQLQVDRPSLLAKFGHEFLEATISGIDCLQQRVVTTEDQWLDYDALIIATGSQADDHGVAGVAEHAIFPRSIVGCLRIGSRLSRLAALPSGRDVVLVGGGFEGLEMLGEILHLFGTEKRFTLHLVEMDNKLFPRFPGLHEYLLETLDGQVQLHMGRRVVAVHADHVALDNGSSLPSRLTIWSGGRRSHSLAQDNGLAEGSDDAPVHATLQSMRDAQIFIAGDAAGLTMPLEKQSYYAQGMGAHAALNVQRLLAGKTLRSFRPLRRPVLLSLGDREGVMFYGNYALASPTLVALKEAAYQYGFHLWQAPRSGKELLQTARDIRHGMQPFDIWQIFRRKISMELMSRSALMFVKR